MSSDPLSPQIEWGDQAVLLRDFTARQSACPCLVKVTRGQYRNIGAAKSVYSELLLHSVRNTKKVLAESLRVKDSGRRVANSDQRFSLPDTYQGWFELLSEDGKAIRPLQGVAELARQFPNACLVRDQVRAYLAEPANGSGGIAELTPDRARILNTGETLTLVAGDLQVPAGGVMRRCLSCRDSNDDLLFLPYDGKGGVFSPIAGQTNISGVHQIVALLEKFRLPVTVRLVHGVIPSRIDKGNFNGVFRFLSTYSDETCFVTPLRQDAKMVPVPTRESLRFVLALNSEQLLQQSSVYIGLSQRCSKMVASYLNSIHVLVSSAEAADIRGTRKSLPTGTPGHVEQLSEDPKSSAQVTSLPKVEEDILFEEIDDIYQYVREGGRPPPPRPRPGDMPSNASFYHHQHQQQHRQGHMHYPQHRNTQHNHQIVNHHHHHHHVGQHSSHGPHHHHSQQLYPSRHNGHVSNNSPPAGRLESHNGWADSAVFVAPFHNMAASSPHIHHLPEAPEPTVARQDGTNSPRRSHNEQDTRNSSTRLKSADGIIMLDAEDEIYTPALPPKALTRPLSDGAKSAGSGSGSQGSGILRNNKLNVMRDLPRQAYGTISDPTPMPENRVTDRVQRISPSTSNVNTLDTAMISSTLNSSNGSPLSPMTTITASPPSTPTPKSAVNLPTPATTPTFKPVVVQSPITKVVHNNYGSPVSKAIDNSAKSPTPKVANNIPYVQATLKPVSVTPPSPAVQSTVPSGRALSPPPLVNTEGDPTSDLPVTGRVEMLRKKLQGMYL